MAELIRSLFPAEKYPRWVNLHPDCLDAVRRATKLAFTEDGSGDLVTDFGPEDVLHYMYALLHSTGYRSRYAHFLKTDFPRIPITDQPELFAQLVRLGAALAELHLHGGQVHDVVTHYPVPGPNLVGPGCPRYLAPGQPDPATGDPLQSGRVYISRDDPQDGAPWPVLRGRGAGGVGV